MSGQAPPYEEKLSHSQDNDQKDPSQTPSDVAPSSSTEPAAALRNPSPKEEQETSQKAPPLPSKSPDDSVPVDLKQLGEFTYYRATSIRVASPSREELPDDLFEPTAEDLRSAQASLVARSRAYREAPLLTESLRKKKEEELINRYPTTTIRIKFADRSMLEKNFPSTSFIKPVYAFVRSCLHEAAKPHKFLLYEPPRRELKVSDPKVRDKSLLDLHLAPRSILHFRFLDDDVKLDPANGPPPLYPEILSLAVSLTQPASQTSESPSSQSSGTKGSKQLDGLDKDKKIARLLKLGSGKK